MVQIRNTRSDPCKESDLALCLVLSLVRHTSLRVKRECVSRLGDLCRTFPSFQEPLAVCAFLQIRDLLRGGAPGGGTPDDRDFDCPCTLCLHLEQLCGLTGMRATPPAPQLVQALLCLRARWRRCPSTHRCPSASIPVASRAAHHYPTLCEAARDHAGAPRHGGPRDQ